MSSEHDDRDIRQLRSMLHNAKLAIERMTTEEKDRILFEAWKSREAERMRKRGDYWISVEGRAEIRETWGDPEDGNCVLPLLNALEALEKVQNTARSAEVEEK